MPQQNTVKIQDRNAKGQFTDKFIEVPKSQVDAFVKKMQAKLLKQGMKAAQQASMVWLQKQVDEFKATRSGKLTRTNFQIGKMYFFWYDAKWKDKLPYWDMFPLVIPIEIYKDGFLGINFHYLPVKGRVLLLNSLMNLATDKNLDEHTKFNISYGMLKGAAKQKLFEPTIHRYLGGHLRSPFLPVESWDWPEAVMLPVQSFVGASDKQIWKDSMRGGK